MDGLLAYGAASSDSEDDAVSFDPLAVPAQRRATVMAAGAGSCDGATSNNRERDPSSSSSSGDEYQPAAVEGVIEGMGALALGDKPAVSSEAARTSHGMGAPNTPLHRPPSPEPEAETAQPQPEAETFNLFSPRTWSFMKGSQSSEAEQSQDGWFSPRGASGLFVWQTATRPNQTQEADRQAPGARDAQEGVCEERNKPGGF